VEIYDNLHHNADHRISKVWALDAEDLAKSAESGTEYAAGRAALQPSERRDFQLALDWLREIGREGTEQGPALWDALANPPRYLEPGDAVECGIEGLGELRQRVVAWA
jgi:2-keto-4-pentenoate hydratase/2-oxohepta-3-ene-1,7-dioic acid hydratase in catechol pathway